MSYVRYDGTLLTPAGGNWTRDLKEGGPVRIRLRGRDLLARPELVQDPAGVARLRAVMADANPALQRFVRIPRGADRRPDPAASKQPSGTGSVSALAPPETPLPG